MRCKYVWAGSPGVLCDAGGYCPGGGTAPLPCPANTESGAGALKAAECTAVAGFYSSPPGGAALHLLYTSFTPDLHIRFYSSPPGAARRP